LKRFEFIEDLKSDVMFKAYGKSLEELFANAALGLFSVICQVDEVGHRRIKLVKVRGENIEDLMFNWLQELIGIVETDNLFLSRFEILKIGEDGTYLEAKCYGEGTAPEKGGAVVKGVTYYKYELRKTRDGYSVRVSLDI